MDRRGSMRRWRAARVALATMMLLAWAAALPVAATEPAKGGGSRSGPAQPIDINRASAEELTAIPGVGMTIAQRIVDFREKNGPFRRVEDLLKVKGIGEKSLEKIRPHVKVEAKS